jgi:hypothetical protein
MVQMFTHCHLIVQEPKAGMSTIGNPAPSVHAGVVTPARKSAGLIYIYAYPRLSPFSSRPLTEAGPFLRWDGGTLDGIHIGTGFARDAPSCVQTPKRTSVR